MPDATVLVPTHDHAQYLPYSLRSALDQDGVEIELFVVGDGVEDETRASVTPFLDDQRVRFFDFPKGERYGERLRHEALAEATGDVVCYLEDDDLLLPGHVEEMIRLLENADFAHSAPFFILEDGEVVYQPFDLARPEFHAFLLAPGRNSIGLTGASHTLAAYRRLPHGWRAAPPDVATDKHMWQQWVSQPWFRGVTGRRPTHLHYPEHAFRKLDPAMREAFLARELEASRREGFEDELAAIVTAAERRAGEKLVLDTLGVDAMRATRTWRLRERLLRLRP
jgi:glycosyltransferase involved in cell wall biosynthesis